MEGSEPGPGKEEEGWLAGACAARDGLLPSARKAGAAVGRVSSVELHDGFAALCERLERSVEVLAVWQVVVEGVVGGREGKLGAAVPATRRRRGG